jgi:hypothetical protein
VAAFAGELFFPARTPVAAARTNFRDDRRTRSKAGTNQVSKNSNHDYHEDAQTDLQPERQ